MTNVTQQIPNYVGGISQQPDELKVPGQVRTAKNVLPDVTHGLLKRPGGRLIGGNLGAYTTTSKWFHYYRDENEQYIGQIQLSDGEIKMWRCCEMTINGTTHAAGSSVTVNYESGQTTELKNYLKQTNSGGTITDADIQTLTLNDYTYLTNRNKTTAMAATVETVRPPEVYIELKKVAYASQYSVNLFDDTTTEEVYTATRIDVDREIDSSNACASNGSFPSSGALPGSTGSTRCNLSGTDFNNDDDMNPNVGTKIFSVDHNTAGNAADANNTAHTYTVADPWATGTTYAVGDKVSSGGKIYKATTAGTSTGSTAPSHTSGTVTVGGNGWEFYGERKNLYFRLTTTGQSVPQGSSSSPEYISRYTTTHDLLYGGEGWRTGDVFYVWLKNAKYKITIAAHSVSKVQANRGLIRPEPTSFDTKTVVTAESIIGAIRTEIDNDAGANFDAVQQIGNGLYITRSSGTFNITSPVGELLNVLSGSVEDVADLPNQCKHGYVVKVANSEAEEDDYYVKFIGKLKTGGNEDNDLDYLDGDGVWEECAKPGTEIAYDPATMPIQLIREGDANGTFTVKQVTWENALVGDTAKNATNPRASFVGQTINKMLFFRNRLVMLSDENVIMSQPGEFFNFWSKSAITHTATDMIDLSCSSEYPAIVYDGLQVNAGLVLFTKNQQFMLTTDSDILSPLTAKINAVSSYNFNFNTNPVSLGTTIAFLDNAGKYTRFFEMQSVLREGEVTVLEQSKNISKAFPKDINLIANSRENSTIFFATKGTSKLYGFRYYTTGEQRLQQSWFEWELGGEIQHIAMLDDALFAIVENIVNDKSFTGNGSLTSFDTEFNPMPTLAELNVQINGIDQTSGFSLSGSNIVFTSAPANNSTIRVYQPRSVMQKFSIRLDDNSHTIVEDATYRVHLDNAKSFAHTNLTYVSNGHYTKFDHTAVDFNSSRQLYAVAVTPSTESDKTFNGQLAKVTTFDDNGTTKVKLPGNWKTYTITPTRLKTDAATRAGNTITIAYTSHPFKVGDALQLLFTEDGSAMTDGNYTVATVSDDKNSFTVTDSASGTISTAQDVQIESVQTPVHDIIIGYDFDMEVEFPTIYVGRREGESYRSDIQASLVLQRTKFSLGPSGVYKVTLKRIGKPDYSEVFESVKADTYTANTAGIDGEQVINIPIYEKNTNLTLLLNSQHPSPATLYSMNWEGNYSDRYYKRV